MVLGETRSFVAALVTLDPLAVEAWAGAHGRTAPDGGWHTDSELTAVVADAVADANGLVSRAESIREFRLVAGDFTVANGQLTPSLKLRRTVIENSYAADIAALYTPR
jgi:long-chain acyl-CoA synthetase